MVVKVYLIPAHGSTPYKGSIKVTRYIFSASPVRTIARGIIHSYHRGTQRAN